MNDADIATMVRAIPMTNPVYDTITSAVGRAALHVPTPETTASESTKPGPTKTGKKPRVAKTGDLTTVRRAVAETAKAGASKDKPATKKAGAKRDKQDLIDLQERLHQHITASPGLGVEQIGKAIGVSTKDLVLPVKKLLAAKKIRSEGAKRATRYWPTTATNGATPHQTNIHTYVPDADAAPAAE
jgi:hypothetical protein